MFEIGWTELVVIAVVAVLVVGPKDLPRMLRTFGQLVGKARRMASDFQHQFNDALKEAERQAEMDDLRKQVESLKTAATVAVDPMKAVRDEIAKLGPTATAPLATPSPAGAPLPLTSAGASPPAGPDVTPAGPDVTEGVTLSGPSAPAPEAAAPPTAAAAPAPVSAPAEPTPVPPAAPAATDTPRSAP